MTTLFERPLLPNGRGGTTEIVDRPNFEEKSQNSLGSRPSKAELLAAASGFWSRLKVHFKWLTIRSTRPFNADEIYALFSWILECLRSISSNRNSVQVNNISKITTSVKPRLTNWWLLRFLKDINNPTDTYTSYIVKDINNKGIKNSVYQLFCFFRYFLDASTYPCCMIQKKKSNQKSNQKGRWIACHRKDR